MAIFFALIAFLGWGVGDVFGALASRKVGNTVTYFWALFFMFVLSTLYLPFAGSLPDLNYFIIAFLLGVFDCIGTIFYFKGFEVGNVSLNVAISGSFGMVTVLLSLLFFHESLTYTQFIGVILTVAGVILVSLKLKRGELNISRVLFSDKAVKYGLSAMISWGIYFAVIRVVVDRIGWFWTWYPVTFFFAIMYIIGWVKKDALSIVRKEKTLWTIIIFSFLVGLAQASYGIGITFGYSSVVAPIAASFPIITVAISRFVFKDKLTLQQKAGIVATLLGIVIISVG